MLGSASQSQADAGGKYGIAQKENRLKKISTTRMQYALYSYNSTVC